MRAAGFAPRRTSSRIGGGSRGTAPQEDFESTRDDAHFFRAQTLAIVRHFFEIACQIGRVSSILGREFFRAKVTHHAIPSFEDQVVFVHDVERALAGLDPQDADVLGLVGLYQYSLDEAAALLGRSRSSVIQRFAESVDRLAEIFLATGLLRENRPDRRLQRFDLEESPARAADLPPKKPAASASFEEFYEVTGRSAKYSFTAQRVIG
jgi:hypothetical protein